MNVFLKLNKTAVGINYVHISNHSRAEKYDTPLCPGECSVKTAFSRSAGILLLHRWRLVSVRSFLMKMIKPLSCEIQVDRTTHLSQHVGGTGSSMEFWSSTELQDTNTLLFMIPQSEWRCKGKIKGSDRIFSFFLLLVSLFTNRRPK